jgi:prepilin-type N-terminal cleavage/methylation domain-containing protein
MRQERGFTLVEIMVATLILAVVIGALVTGLVQCFNLTNLGREQDIALNAAQEKIEEIANSNLNDSTIVYYNGQVFNVSGLSSANPGLVNLTQLYHNSSPTDLFDLNVTISWQQSSGRNISRSLTTTLVKK